MTTCGGMLVEDGFEEVWVVAGSVLGICIGLSFGEGREGFFGWGSGVGHFDDELITAICSLRCKERNNLKLRGKD